MWKIWRFPTRQNKELCQRWDPKISKLIKHYNMHVSAQLKVIMQLWLDFYTSRLEWTGTIKLGGGGWGGAQGIPKTWILGTRSDPIHFKSQVSPLPSNTWRNFPPSLACNFSFFYFIDLFGQKDTIEPPNNFSKSIVTGNNEKWCKNWIRAEQLKVHSQSELVIADIYW